MEDGSPVDAAYRIERFERCLSRVNRVNRLRGDVLPMASDHVQVGASSRTDQRRLLPVVAVAVIATTMACGQPRQAGAVLAPDPAGAVTVLKLPTDRAAVPRGGSAPALAPELVELAVTPWRCGPNRTGPARCAGVYF
jgi:hypothetical protein